MPSKESREVLGEQAITSVFGSAKKWGRGFVERLETLFLDAASHLPPGADQVEFRKAMIAAIAVALDWEKTSPQEIQRAIQEPLDQGLGLDPQEKWSSDKSARRLELIDKWIQQKLSSDESIELDHLTALLRSAFDTEEMVPLAGARRLHRQLLGIDEPEDASD
jgi:hypothetical protein